MNALRKQLIVAAGFALGAFSSQIAAAAVLYGVTGSSNSPSSLYTVDPITGATSLIGATGFSHVTGIDVDPTSGTLYGVVSDIFGSGTTQLITINKTTGAGTVVGSTGNEIPDLTIGPDGVLRGWSEWNGSDPDNPVVVDKATGTTTVTSSSLGTANTGVAWASPTSIYVKSGSSLFTVDVNTGAATFLFDTGVFLRNLLENAPDGTLISGDRVGGGTQFYSIDLGTQQTTALGFAADVAFSAIAYDAVLVPEPMTLGLLGFGLAGLGLARYRRR